ncbi:MAG: hypothetical protein ACJ74W_14390 [Pyrinomonadaceae bacterium]
MVMDADVPVVESGGKADFQYGNDPTTLYTSTKVDRVLHDGDEVKFGGTTVEARSAFSRLARDSKMSAQGLLTNEEPVARLLLTPDEHRRELGRGERPQSILLRQRLRC